MKTSSKHDDGINYYVERTLRLCTFKKSLLEDEKILHISSEQELPEPGCDRDILLILNYNQADDNFNAAKQFEKLCKFYPEKNIHLVHAWTLPDLYFVWLRSQGSLGTLRHYLDNPRAEFSPASVINDDKLLNNNVVILAADPGMGKTTFLAALASKTKKAHPSAWIVRINLLDHTSQFRRFQKDRVEINRNVAEQFLLELCGYSDERNQCRVFEQNLFMKCCLNWKLIILVDGFDEVSPDYNKIVLDLLSVFRESFASTLWIASRSGNIQCELEDHLEIFAHGLKPFTGNDTRTFLRKYWSLQLKIDPLDEEKFKTFTDKLIDQFKHSLDQRGLEFMSVPLQIKMIAIIFQKDFKAFHESDDYQNLKVKQEMLDLNKDLIEVYEKFIEIKFDILEAEKYQVDTSLPLNRISHDRNYEQFIEKHKLIAVHTLFNEPELDLLLSKEQQSAVKKHLDVVRNYEEKTGIIYHVVGDKALFVHMTYAEYFVALFLFEKLHQEESTFQKLVDVVVVQNLIVKNKTQICRFLQLKAKRDMVATLYTTIKINVFTDGILKAFEKFRNAASGQMIKFVEHCLCFEEWNTVTRKLVDRKPEQSKTFLLIELSGEDCVELVRVTAEIVKNVNCSINNNNNTALQKACSRGHLRLVKMLLEHTVDIDMYNNEYGFTALHYASMNGHTEVMKVLLKNHANLSIPCRLRGYNALHWAIFQNRVGAVSVLLGEGADINTRTRGAEQTPLYLATSSGHSVIVKLLLERGCFVNSQIPGPTPSALICAIKQGYADIALLLLSYGADANAESTNKGWTPMHYAAHYGQAEMVRILIEHGALINVRSLDNSSTPLMEASSEGHYSVVEILLQKGATLNTISKIGYMALHYAAEKGHVKVASILLDHGAIIDAAYVYNQDQTPLLIALSNGHTGIVELLLNRGIEVDKFTPVTGQTPLMVAAGRGYTEIAKLLLQKGANVHAKSVTHQLMPLHYAVYHGHVETIALLLEYGAKVDATAANGQTPLFLALTRGDKAVVDVLVQKYPETLKTESTKALMHVLPSNNMELIKMIIQSGPNVNAPREGDGYTALHLVVQAGNIKILQLMFQFLEVAVDVPTDQQGITPFMVACANGHLEIVHFLLECGCDVRLATNKISWTPLHAAALGGHKEIVEILLNYGADINAATSSSGLVPLWAVIDKAKIAARKIIFKNILTPQTMEDFFPSQLDPKNVRGINEFYDAVEGGITALHLASDRGHTTVVELLLTKGALVNSRTMNNHTALFLASRTCQPETVETLLNNGADVEIHNGNEGFTALHIAAEMGYKDIIELLLKHGADIDARSSDKGKTPLMLAAEENRMTALELLLTKGANANAATTDNGSTALHLATTRGREGIVSKLLSQGAAPNSATTDAGFTPLHLACQKGHEAIVLDLLSASADASAITNDGRTPKHLATENGHFEIAEKLELFYNNKLLKQQ